MTYPPATYPVQEPVRRRRWPRRLLITVIVLIALLIGADRLSLVIAENVAATTFQNSQHLDKKPSVSVGGLPFLTQLAAGNFDDVTVKVSDLILGQQSQTLRVHTLDVRLHGVVVSDNLHVVHARSATADLHVSYADLSSTLGTTISYAGPATDGGGRLKAAKTVTVLGVTVTAQASAEVRASSAKGLSFTNPQVSVSGQAVPAEATQFFTGLFATTIPLTGLPFGVQVAGLDTTASGLVVHLSGTNLVYER